MTYIVTCLTYKRKHPKIMKMLAANPQLVVHFGVRREEFESGYYDEWKNNPQIKFLLLDNVIDAADTRQKILDQCYKMGYEYVVQFDDTVTDIVCTKDKNLNVNDCIELAIHQIETSALNAIGFEFVKPGCKQFKIRKAYIQAWIINVRKLYKANIHFRLIKEVGWDDFVFSWEVHNAGFYTLADPNLVRKSKSLYPWANEAGGTHVNESFNIDDMIAKNNARCAKAKQWLEENMNAKNVSIRKLTKRGRTFDYVHAEWR